MRRRDPEGKRGGQRTDRPIAAPDHPIPAEAFDRMLDIRSEVVDGPSSRLGIGDDAGNLDRDIGTPCDSAIVSRQGCSARSLIAGTPQWSRTNWTEGARSASAIALSIWSGRTQRSNGSAVPASRLILARKRRAFTQVVGDDMQHAAESFDERIGGLTVEKGGKVVVLRPTGADRAPQKALGLGAQGPRHCGFRARYRRPRRRPPCEGRQ